MTAPRRWWNALRDRRTSDRRCACGHGRDAHEHYRRGSDCALCDCPAYRRE